MKIDAHDGHDSLVAGFVLDSNGHPNLGVRDPAAGPSVVAQSEIPVRAAMTFY